MSGLTKRGGGGFSTASQLLRQGRVRQAAVAASSSAHFASPELIEVPDSDDEVAPLGPNDYELDEDEDPLPPPLSFGHLRNTPSPVAIAGPSSVASTVASTSKSAASTDPSPGTVLKRTISDRFSYAAPTVARPGSGSGTAASTHFGAGLGARSFGSTSGSAVAGPSKPNAKPKKVDDLEADVESVRTCPFCELSWTARKTASEKIKHIRKCAKEHVTTADEATIRDSLARSAASVGPRAEAPTLFANTVGALKGAEVGEIRIADAPGATQATREGAGLVKAARKAVKTNREPMRNPSIAATPILAAAIDDFGGTGLTQRPSASYSTVRQDSPDAIPSLPHPTVSLPDAVQFSPEGAPAPTQRFAPSKLAARRNGGAMPANSSNGPSLFAAAGGSRGDTTDEGGSIIDRIDRSKRLKLSSSNVGSVGSGKSRAEFTREGTEIVVDPEQQRF